MKKNALGAGDWLIAQRRMNGIKFSAPQELRTEKCPLYNPPQAKSPAAQNKKNLRAGVEKTTDPEVFASVLKNIYKTFCVLCWTGNVQAL